MRLSLDRFILVTLLYQAIIVIFYNKAARYFTYINKLAYLIASLLLVFLIKVEGEQNLLDLEYLIPISLTSLLILVYDTNKGFAQYSLRNKFFPSFVALLILVSYFINLGMLNYALILSASYDLLIVSDARVSHKKFIAPFFIISSQLLGILFNIGIDNDMLFVVYWILVSKLFPFSMLRDRDTSVDEHYLSRSILLLGLAFGNVTFSFSSLLLLSGALFASLLGMCLVRTESQSFTTFRSIILSTIILLCILSGKKIDEYFTTAILWIDFYFMGLVVSRLNTQVTDGINRKIGNAFFFLVFSGVLFGASKLVIQQNIKILLLIGQINLALIMLLPIVFSAAVFFSRDKYEVFMAEKIRKFDHFDTFISQLIILIGVILSI